MGQISISHFEYAGKRKQTRSERLLAEMDQVVPWTGLLRLIKPFYPLVSQAQLANEPHHFLNIERRASSPNLKHATSLLTVPSDRAYANVNGK
jgi:hypothetical protein